MRNRFVDHDATKLYKSKNIYFIIFLWAMLASFTIGSFYWIFNIIFQENKSKGGKSLGLVNGLPISKKDFDFRVKQEYDAINAMKKQFGPEIQQMLFQMQGKPEVKILDEMKLNLVATSAIKQVGLEIPHKYVEQSILNEVFWTKNLPHFTYQSYNNKGEIDINALLERLSSLGYTDANIENIVRQSLEVSLMQDLIYSCLYVSKNDIKDCYIKEYGKRKYQFLKIPITNYLNKIKFSDHELEEYFEKNNQSYFVQEKRSGKLYKMSLSNYGNKMPIDKFAKIFKLDAQKQIDENKENFNKFILNKKAVIEDISKQELGSGLKLQRLFQLKNSGQKAYFVEGDTGYIVELTNISKGYIPEFALVKNKVKEDLTRALAINDLQSDLLKYKQELIDGTKLSDLAKKLNLSVQTTDFIDFLNKSSMEYLKDNSISADAIKPLILVDSNSIDLTGDSGFIFVLNAIKAVDENEFKNVSPALLISAYENSILNISGSFMKFLENKSVVKMVKE